MSQVYCIEAIAKISTPPTKSRKPCLYLDAIPSMDSLHQSNNIHYNAIEAGLQVLDA